MEEITADPVAGARLMVYRLYRNIVILGRGEEVTGHNGPSAPASLQNIFAE